MTTRFKMLGTVEGVRDGVPLALGGAKQKTVLAVLLLADGRTVSVDRLVESVWGEDPAEGAIATLRVFISNLRRVVTPTSADGIQFDGNGYRCKVPFSLDVFEFEEQCRVASMAPAETEARTWRQALTLFHGDPLSGLEHTEPIRREQVRLAEARSIALDSLFAAELTMSRHREILPELFVAADEQPMREQVWSALMVALYRAGRQAEALRVFQQFRQRMIDELGIEPSPDMRRLEQAVLDQSSDLDVSSVSPRRRTASTIDVRAAQPDARLELEDGRVVVLTRRITVVGREDSADVSIDDRRVSRQHAIIRSRLGRYELVDDGSTNGTEANGQGIHQHDLAHGDIISLGGFEIRFVQ